MEVADIVEVALKSGVPIEDHESLVAFTLGFADGARTTDSNEPIHLYGVAESVSCLGLLAFLFDAKIPHDFHDMSGSDLSLSNEVALLTPYRTLPVLTHARYTLHESSAMFRYICRAFPAATGKYYGNGSIQIQCFIDAAMEEKQLGLYSIAAPLIFGAMGKGPKLSQSQAEEVIGKFNDRINIFLDHFVSKSKFVGGDQPSIADFSVMGLLSGFRCAKPYMEKLSDRAKEYLMHFEAATPGWIKAYDGITNGIGSGRKQFEALCAKKFQLEQ